MGSGKSSVGKRLANRLDYEFVDLDTRIEEFAKASIESIFEKNGEEEFRALETYVLSKVLNESRIVLATGGGTPCHSDNMQRLLDSGMVVYLELLPKKLKNRLQSAKTNRPLLKGIDREEELLSFIEEHLAKRRPFYEKAHLTVNADKINAQALDDMKSSLIKMSNAN